MNNRTSSVEQIAVVLWPVFFPILKLVREKDRYYSFFGVLLLCQWIIYVTSIKHLYLAVGIANLGILCILMANPYWSMNLSTCFGEQSMGLFNNTVVRVMFAIIAIFIVPPFLGKTVEFIVGLFFSSAWLLTDNEIYAEHLNWTNWHRVSSLLVLFGFCILQATYKKYPEFFKFFFNSDPCDNDGYEFSSSGAVYYFGVFIFVMIVAYFFGEQTGMSII